MNRNSIFDITVYPLFVVVILFISIITILGIVGLQFMIHDNPNRFDDSVLSFEFLSFVLLSTVPLTVVPYLLTVFRSSPKNPKKIKKRISGKALVDNVESSYPDLGMYVLRIMAFQKGQTDAVVNNFASCYKFIQENLLHDYKVDWSEVARIVKNKKQKRLYRNRKQEKELTNKIIEESE